MLFWLLLPFFLQAAATAFDELYFHVNRGLPTWEKIGHPVDTFTVLACYGIVTWTPFSREAATWYAVAAAVSTLFITKDEFVHARQCRPGEHWLHSALFVLHPTTLVCAGLLWAVRDGAAAIPGMAPSDGKFLGLFLRIQFGMLIFFFLYQIVFWNFVWNKLAARR